MCDKNIGSNNERLMYCITNDTLFGKNVQINDISNMYLKR